MKGLKYEILGIEKCIIFIINIPKTAKPLNMSIERILYVDLLLIIFF
tara:strand:- start:1520 stop:1660 length:141 start_codon:yes stop_codon:yes gene_type:complete